MVRTLRKAFHNENTHEVEKGFDLDILCPIWIWVEVLRMTDRGCICVISKADMKTQCSCAWITEMAATGSGCPDRRISYLQSINCSAIGHARYLSSLSNCDPCIKEGCC